MPDAAQILTQMEAVCIDLSDENFIVAARAGWPATIRALKELMRFAEHENSLWGDPENPAAQALTKAKAILEGRDA